MSNGTYAHKKPKAKEGMVSFKRKKTNITVEKRKIKVLLCKMTESSRQGIEWEYGKKTNNNRK